MVRSATSAARGNAPRGPESDSASGVTRDSPIRVKEEAAGQEPVVLGVLVKALRVGAKMPPILVRVDARASALNQAAGPGPVVIQPPIVAVMAALLRLEAVRNEARVPEGGARVAKVTRLSEARASEAK